MRVVVVGAGIVGTFVAHRLAASGAHVVLLDAATPGAGASATSFAWLNSNNVEDPDYHALRRIGMAAYRELAKELGSDQWLHLDGNLHLGWTRAASDSLQKKVSRLRSTGYPAELISVGHIADIEPSLHLETPPTCAAFFPTEGYLDTTLLMSKLLAAFRSYGGEMRRGRAVVLVRNAAGRVSGVQIEGSTTIEADTVVHCAGANSELLATVGVRVSLRGAVGGCAITQPLPLDVRGVIHLPDLSVRPDGNGRLMLRAKDVDDMVQQADMSLDEAAIETLLARARKYLRLDGIDMAISEVRTAFRPRPPDGLPLVGPIANASGAYLVSSHSGVTIGAVIGRIVAREILDGVPDPLLEPFRPDRTLTVVTDEYQAESASMS